MQFLPTDISSFFSLADKASAKVSGNVSAGRDALSKTAKTAGADARQVLGAAGDGQESISDEFLRLVHEAIDAVDGGEEISVTAALKDSAPLVQGPYSRHTTDGVTYSLDEVCFTKKELQELRRELIKAGAPQEALTRFDDLAGQPDGAVLAQVMASLQQVGIPRQLSAEDKQNITALLGKIDPTGDLSQEALSLMEEGHGQEALTLISQTLSALETSGGLEVRKEQLLSLCKGLGLDKNVQQEIVGVMGDYDAGLFSSAQFHNLMAPARTQFAEEDARQGKVNAALESALKPIVAKARARMEKEKAATALQLRTVEQSKTHIKKTVLQKSRNTLERTLQEGQSGLEAQAQSTTAVHSDAAVHGKAAASRGNSPEAVNKSDAISGNTEGPSSNRNKSAAAAPAPERVGLPLKAARNDAAPTTNPAETEFVGLEKTAPNQLSALANAGVASARLSRESRPTPRTAEQTRSTQVWLAERISTQSLRPAVSDATPPELTIARPAGGTPQRAERNVLRAQAAASRQGRIVRDAIRVDKTAPASTADAAATAAAPAARAARFASASTADTAATASAPTSRAAQFASASTADTAAAATVAATPPNTHLNTPFAARAAAELQAPVVEAPVSKTPVPETPAAEVSVTEIPVDDSLAGARPMVAADLRADAASSEAAARQPGAARAAAPQPAAGEKEPSARESNAMPDKTASSTIFVEGGDNTANSDISGESQDSPADARQQMGTRTASSDKKTAFTRSAASDAPAAPVAPVENGRQAPAAAREMTPESPAESPRLAKTPQSGEKPAPESDVKRGNTIPAQPPAASAPHDQTWAARTAQPESGETSLPGQAARQVQENIRAALREVRDGHETTRLDVQLHPQELGAISIALISRNGEVTARIRADRDETAEMLARQTEQVRAGLEAQGVRVEKIEVQLHNRSEEQARDDIGRQNPDQNSAWQEKDSRRETLFRQRTLATIRNSFTNSEPEILEQPVHYSGLTARYADQALHLVA
ncbi:MAG: flagellar hook-length control protein FliK [Desulfovibrio sp.]|jgi:flagellar hook-length control protein FliK|nr:flagellar hook-length control protein FliK [Desulfovibrio sp.]